VAAEEATAEQRALLSSFKMQCHDKAAQHFMHAERMAAAERLGDARATARANTHHHNIEAAKAVMEAGEQRLAEVDRSEGLASVVEERHP
jgi:hypothetical protein